MGGIFGGFSANYSKPGPGVNTPVPEKGPKRYWHLLKTHFTKLVGVNLLYSIIFIPIYAALALNAAWGAYSMLFLLLLVFMPAFRSGCARAMMVIARKGNCFVFHEFKKEFGVDFFKRLFACICLIALPLIIWFFVGLTGNIVGFGSAVGFTAIVFVVFAYLFPMWTITNIPVGRCVKNAILLTVIEWKKSLLVLLVSGVSSVLCILYMPFTFPLLVMVLYAITWLFEAMVVNTMLIKHGIIPEDSEEKTDSEIKEISTESFGEVTNFDEMLNK